ncbi:MAG: FtsX-like permease family protein [Gemmatimonadetes bacterium]|nr:FtsX-like permease family protein [Gemmatimonadota bacterium]
MSGHRPPRWLERVLERMLPSGLAGQGALGDLAEGFERRALTSPMRARFWYAGQTASIVTYRILTGEGIPSTGSSNLLMGGTALLLLVTALNVGNLLLGRAIERRHELAVRTALGAGRGRIVGQLLVEGIVWTGLALVVGLAAGSFAGTWIADLFVGETVVTNSPMTSPAVLGFAASVALLSWLVLSGVPISHYLRSQRHGLIVLAGLAMGLGAVGIYAVLAHHVALSKREIGVRMALGAKPSALIGSIVRSGMILAGVGILLGSVGAALSTRALDSLLFGVSALAPWAFVGPALLLLSAAGLAALIPAARAGRLPAAEVLRGE